MQSSSRWLGLLGTLVLIGCGDSPSSPSDSEQTPADVAAASPDSLPQPANAAGADRADGAEGAEGADSQASATANAQAGVQARDEATPRGRPPATEGSPGGMPRGVSDGAAGPAETSAHPADENLLPSDRLQLAAELTPPALIQFLGKADRAMRMLASSASSAAEFEQREPELQRLARLKREAAERVIAHAAAPPALLKQAKRGRLQALSHLAAMGDLAAAKQLESEAKTLAASSDPMLAIESRLVLIGFALDALQTGAAEDPQQVIDLVTQLTAHAEILDMPALMAIGQARAVLEQYGYDTAAQQVRDQLVVAFADHPNPEVAALAQQIAGSERFDRLDALQRSLERGETVTPTEWKRAATAVAAKNPDRLTLQYLASTALAFESEARAPLAEATYELLRSVYSEHAEESLSEELARILGSRQARQQVVGTRFEIDLPGLHGEAIDWSRYRGQVVLVPFWAAEYPDSITIFPLLEQIRAADPDQIAILGVNLDVEDASVAALTSQIQPDWASVRSPEPADRGARNALAQQVGLASMPFVVVVDREGRVAAVSMTGEGLEEVVRDLLQEA